MPRDIRPRLDGGSNMRRSARGTAVLLAILVLGACAAPSAAPTSAPRQAQSESASSTGHKRLAVAVFRDFTFLPNDPSPGAPDGRALVNPGLTTLDDRGGHR